MIVIFHSLYFLIKYCLQIIKRRRCLQEYRALQAMHEKANLETKIIDAEENLSFDPPVYRQRYGTIQQILLDNKWKSHIKKIVDFGCAEFGLFQFIRRLCRIEEILEVDIDEELLKDNLFRIQPLTVDYLSKRTEPLVVRVLSGSVGDPDRSLISTDVVIAIEIIEHLYPDTLDALPYNIFGFIKPKLAIFTTPNADFNVLFPNFKGIRHSDHKFEWNREQFESWARNISTRFPEYSISFKGIGQGPKGTEHLGCCSQMVVFLKEDGSEDNVSNTHVEGSMDVMNSTCTCKHCTSQSSFGVCKYFSCTEMFYGALKLSSIPTSTNDSEKYVKDVNDYYKVVHIVEYPFDVDERSPEQKILDELKYRLCLMGNINGRFFNDDLNRFEIPLIELVFNQYTHFTTVCEAREILDKAGYKIEECMICGELETCIIYEPEMESRSSTPRSGTSTSKDDSNSYKEHSEWNTITTDSDTSDWEVSSDIQRGSWAEDFTSQDIQQTEALENVNEIVNNLVNNLKLTTTTQQCTVPATPQKEEKVSNEEGEKCNNIENNTEPNNLMYDSGYYKSNTNLTTSTQSCSDLLDGDILDDQLINSTNLDETDKTLVLPNVINLTNDIYSNETEKVSPNLKRNIQRNEITLTDLVKEKIPRAFTEVYEINITNNANSNDKVDFVAKSTSGVGNLAMTLESKLNVNPNITANKTHHLKDNVRESAPGTSNVKKKKKLKQIENDSSSMDVLKNEDMEKKPESEEELDRKGEVIEGARMHEVVEVMQIPEPIVENGDLANNNRDLEGNNYPDAQQNIQQNDEQNIDGNDNENVVLQNNIHVDGVDLRNEDVENRNANVEEEEEEVNNDAEAVGANSDGGQEASELELEFASREALFDPNSQVDLLEEFHVPVVAVAAPNAVNIEEPQQNVVLIGVGINPNNSDVGPVLPVNADPFPNWLLRLLGADMAEEGEPHDEPHFYCQGDGIAGVHPSFVEDDFEEDHSSSGSDSTGSTNDDAEAEPTVSEVEVVSLPDDTNEEGPEQNAAAAAEAAAAVAPMASTEESVGSENHEVTSPAGAGTSSGAESADEFFDTLDESLSINSNRSEKSQNAKEVQNKN